MSETTQDKKVPVIEGLIGKKVGMTQVFSDGGHVVPVTVLEAGPCVVMQKKTVDSDGYEAIKMALVEGTLSKRVSKPVAGEFKRHEIAPEKRIREFRFAQEEGEAVKVGSEFGVNVFKVNGFA